MYSYEPLRRNLKSTMHGIQLINKTKLCIALTTLIAMLIGGHAYAKDYMVEVIVFENNDAARATERHDYQAPQQMRGGSEYWDVEPSMLLEQAQALESSNNYQVRYYYSWGQESLPYEDSTTYRVSEQDAQGFIKIYADQLLFANLDLDFNGYRMKEKRRLKLNEMHFFDHPKFGLLLQVSRLEADQDLEPTD